MFSSLINTCVETNFYIEEAWSSQDTHIANCLISAIPAVGLIFIQAKEYSASKELLLSMEQGDTPKSIQLINTKNCHKLYLTIHLLVLGVLSIHITGLYGLAFLIAAIYPLAQIYVSHRAIEQVQLPNNSFVVRNMFGLSFPRFRHARLNFMLPSIRCAIRNNTLHQTRLMTIY